MLKVTVALAGALLVATGASAQQGNAIAEALGAEAHSNMTNMVGAAEAMPSEKYSFKFSPDETNTFGALIYHAAMANNLLCSAMAGDKAPETPVKADGAKQALIDQMKASFAYCDTAFPKVTAARMEEKLKLMNRDVTVAWVVVHTALDWGDHYAQVARMLRVNGITPPSAQRRTQ